MPASAKKSSVSGSLVGKNKRRLYLLLSRIATTLHVQKKLGGRHGLPLGRRVASGGALLMLVVEYWAILSRVHQVVLI